MSVKCEVEFTHVPAVRLLHWLVHYFREERVLNFHGIVAELKAERDRLDKAIAALGDVNSTGRGKGARGVRGRRGKSHMTEAGRKRLSLALKRRWAQGKMGRRKKAA